MLYTFVECAYTFFVCLLLVINVQEKLPLFLILGEVLGHLCRHYGPDIYRELEPVLMSGIKDNLERDQDLITEQPQLLEKLSGRQSPDITENERVIRKM